MGINETQIGTGLRPERPSTVINGRYRIERLLGGGGCGVVYAGRHEVLGKPVAIKMLRPELVDDGMQVQRFFREAKLAATLHHENIVDITDFGTDAATGAPYLVMEMLRGRTLMAAVRDDGPLQWERVVTILLQLTRALACAHAQGIIHRDVKPHNVMLAEPTGRDELVKLCDFGLSRLRNGDDRITTTGDFVGTPAYMAPEQIRGAAQDERCDLYAVGVTAYEMLTGALPYASTEPVALIAEILGDTRVPLRERLTSEIPAELITLIEQCLATAPDERPASALAVEQELLAISMEHAPEIAVRTGPFVLSARRPRRARWIAAGASVVVLAACVAIWVSQRGTDLAVTMDPPRQAVTAPIAQPTGGPTVTPITEAPSVATAPVATPAASRHRPPSGAPHKTTESKPPSHSTEEASSTKPTLVTQSPVETAGTPEGSGSDAAAHNTDVIIGDPFQGK
jgi:serine/threonine-protein kinase